MTEHREVGMGDDKTVLEEDSLPNPNCIIQDRHIMVPK